MVLVFHDVGQERTKVWAFLGWDRTLLHVHYEAPPAVVSCERDVRPPILRTPRLDPLGGWCGVRTQPPRRG
jgi:hypothetical protein